MNEIAIGILQAAVALTAAWVVLFILFQVGLRVMYHLKWKHE